MDSVIQIIDPSGTIKYIRVLTNTPTHTHSPCSRMLSTQYRLKLQGICQKIADRQIVILSEMIWCEKLAAHNAHAARILRQARRKAANPDMTEDSLDGFLNALDLGDPDTQNHRTGFSGPDDIVDWFKRDDLTNEDDTWRRRD